MKIVLRNLGWDHGGAPIATAELRTGRARTASVRHLCITTEQHPRFEHSCEFDKARMRKHLRTRRCLPGRAPLNYGGAA